MKGYNLFLDDFRSPRDPFSYTKDTDYLKKEWVHVKNFKEFCDYITYMYGEGHWPDLISFDHDLADEHYDPAMHISAEAYEQKQHFFKEKTGYHCAQWLVELCMDADLPLPEFKVHSMNPVGRDAIHNLLTRFREERNKNKSE